MTFLEIRQLALALVGRQEDQDEEFPHDPILPIFVNEGYTDVCQYAWRPQYSQTVTLEEGSFRLEQLERMPIKILEVMADGYPAAFRHQADDSVTVTTDTPQAQVRYQYLPALMQQDNDEPDFPAAYHAVLADYAAWRLLSIGGRYRQQRAQSFLAQYMAGRARIEDAVGRVESRMRHLYQ